jgi:hypothetical protein
MKERGAEHTNEHSSLPPDRLMLKGGHDLRHCLFLNVLLKTYIFLPLLSNFYKYRREILHVNGHDTGYGGHKLH